MKYYKIDEKTLISLLTFKHIYQALDTAGVDNWILFGNNFEEYIAEYLNLPKEDEDFDCDFEDCAIKDIKENFKEV